jgi:hypothetical protein
MDEKGVQLGIGVKVAAIIDCDQATVYSVKDGNCELVTIIKAICADGTALLPSVIFQVCSTILNGEGLRTIPLLLGMQHNFILN